MNLQGKVAVVTGSGRGLGRAYVEALADAGASIVVNDVDKDVVDETVAQLESRGAEAIGVTAAVGSSETADQLVQGAVSAFGRIDVMVTNAGILRDGVLWKMSDDDFDAVINVHLRGTFTCARAAARQMREQGDGGRLILVASPAGQHGNFGQTSYAAAKAGIVAMARTWAMELSRANITVNAIVPIAATEMTRTIPALAPIFEESDRTGAPFPAWLLKDEGLGTVEDVAPLVTFLASDASSKVTGQAIGIGGHRLALWRQPSEKRAEIAIDGWTSELIADRWATSLADQAEPFGIPAPKIPGA